MYNPRHNHFSAVSHSYNIIRFTLHSSITRETYYKIYTHLSLCQVNVRVNILFENSYRIFQVRNSHPAKYLLDIEYQVKEQTLKSVFLLFAC